MTAAYDVVLARDQLDLVRLAVALGLHGGPQLGVDLRDRGPSGSRDDGNGHGEGPPVGRGLARPLSHGTAGRDGGVLTRSGHPRTGLPGGLTRSRSTGTLDHPPPPRPTTQVPRPSMALRPIAVSVVLAAALLGTNVLHDGGAAVLNGPVAGVAVPSPSAGGPSSPGASAGASGSPAAPAVQQSPGPATRPLRPRSPRRPGRWRSRPVR